MQRLDLVFTSAFLFYFCIPTSDFRPATRALLLAPHITQTNFLFRACFSLRAGGTKIS
jgi:hypothetical protein